jgi:co-chaperonin GroES (HSP10)
MAVVHVKGRVNPVRDHVIIQDMNFGERRTRVGLIIPGDDGIDRGIRPRWGKVYAVGHEQKDVEPGQWVLVSHGRWTQGVDVTDPEGNTVTIRRVDGKDILLVSDENPGADESLTQAHRHDI